MKKLISILSLLLVLSSAYAQLSKADKLFDDFMYAQAIEIYKPLADKGNMKAIKKIAECYRKINDYTNAERYYAFVIADKDASAKSFLYYAQMLITNEKCDEAKIWIDKFIASKPGSDSVIARTLLQSCLNQNDTTIAFRKISVQNLKAINSTAADFCAFPYEGGIVFTSARQNAINGTSGSGFQEVLFANYVNDSTYKIAPIKGVVNTAGYNSGPATIDSLRNIIYFTKNNFKFGDAISNKSGDVTLKIYSAKKSRDGWHDIKSLDLNEKEFSYAFPSINRDGDILFFTSDRPDGYGGKDIYYSMLTNGSWSKPKNAGPNINTSGDERYPFIHTDGTLYFSSTGWPGYGGMDIFKAVPNKLGEFGKPENLGKPFNGPTDDFGFFIDANYDKGFFSSDRSGGLGSDDIYCFTLEDIQFELNLYTNGKMGDSIQVKFYKDKELLKEEIINRKITMYLEPNSIYTFDCSKEGFETEQVIIKTTNSKKPIRKALNLVTTTKSK